MSLIRPEIATALNRWAEVIAGVTAGWLGVWIISLGGVFMAVLGGVVTLSAIAFTVVAWRRMQFKKAIEAPGVVELDEGRISYLGPVMGGSIALSELSQVEIINVAGSRQCWRLRQLDGQALLVPVAAAGSEKLFDLFAGLPGADPAAFIAALDYDLPDPDVIWQRRPEGVTLPSDP